MGVEVVKEVVIEVVKEVEKEVEKEVVVDGRKEGGYRAPVCR